MTEKKVSFSLRTKTDDDEEEEEGVLQKLHLFEHAEKVSCPADF